MSTSPLEPLGRQQTLALRHVRPATTGGGDSLMGAGWRSFRGPALPAQFEPRR